MTPVTKYICESCGSEFRQAAGLSRHKTTCRLLHADLPLSRKHVCSKCEKKFSRKDNLTTHMNNCKGKKENCICPIPRCGMTFKYNSKLTRHIQAHKKTKNKEKKAASCSNSHSRHSTDVSQFVAESYPEQIMMLSMFLSGIVEQNYEDKKQLKRLGGGDISMVLDSDIDFGLTSSGGGDGGSGDGDDDGDDGDDDDGGGDDDGDGGGDEWDELSDDSDAKSENITPILLLTPHKNNLIKEVLSSTINTSDLSAPIENVSTPRFSAVSKVNSFNVDDSIDDTIMSPNSRKRKERVVNSIWDAFKDAKVDLMTKKDQYAILKSVTKKLKLQDTFKSKARGSVYLRGRKRKPLLTRKQVWVFWHENSVASTLSHRPPKLRIGKKPGVQTGLEFKEHIITKNKRGHSFFTSTWQTTEKSFKELFVKYNLENPEHKVGYGTFITLKPFYVRGVTKQDIELCCCKRHLHARWSINALIDCAKKQGIHVPFNSYSIFFDLLTAKCQKSETTYINWHCSPNNKAVCDDIKNAWDEITAALKREEDKDATVKMQHFVTESTGKISEKTGKEIKKLSSKFEKLNLSGIIDFIDILLPDIVHHRNQLKHFRHCIPIINDYFNNCLYSDVDFAENLTVPVKYEPQTMHWSHEQVTVHSGITKFNGEKSYYAHFSENRTHDYIFADNVLRQMIEDVNMHHGVVIVNSDNCSNQYKCAAHFFKLQEVSNLYNSTIIRIWSIAGHGKGEVDHVGGLAKVSIRRAIAGGDKISSCDEMVSFLNEKFLNKNNPIYIIREITENTLDELRSEERLKDYKTIDGSNKFQVAVFTPGSKTFRAAPYLCICDTCQEEYGSCDLFCMYEVTCKTLNKVFLRSHIEVPVGEEDHDETVMDFTPVESVCAIPASKKSADTIDFVKIIAQERINDGNVEITDDWGQVIKGGQRYLEGRYMINTDKNDRGSFYKVDRRKVFMFKESVVYPFVLLEPRKKGYFISNEELCEIIQFVESTGMAHL